MLVYSLAGDIDKHTTSGDNFTIENNLNTVYKEEFVRSNLKVFIFVICQKKVNTLQLQECHYSN